MILHVNFRYEAKVVPPRKVNAVTRYYRGTVPVEIATFSEREAPVAMRFQDDGGRLHQVRWAGDRLLRPLREEDSWDRTGVHRDLAWLQDLAQTAYRTDLGDRRDPLRLSRHVRQAGDLTLAEDRDVRRVEESGEAQAAAAIRGYAERLAVVGGMVYEPSPEPVYKRVIGQAELYGARRVVVAEFLAPEDRNWDPSAVFRADEADYLLDNDLVDLIPDDRRIEIVIPDAVRYDGPERELMRAAANAYEGLKRMVLDGDEGCFRAYKGLRDGIRAVEAAKTEGRQVDYETLVPAVHEALPYGEKAYWLSQVERALQRMDARALGLLEVPGL